MHRTACETLRRALWLKLKTLSNCFRRNHGVGSQNPEASIDSGIVEAVKLDFCANLCNRLRY
jgi:hypothetical protein